MLTKVWKTNWKSNDVSHHQGHSGQQNEKKFEYECYSTVNH